MRFETSVYVCDCIQEYKKYFLVIVIQKEKIYKIELSRSQCDSYRRECNEARGNVLKLEEALINFLSKLNSPSKNLAALKEDSYFKPKITAQENFNKMFGSQNEAKAGEPLSQSSQASLTPTSRTERTKLVVKADAGASAPLYWIPDHMLPHRTKSQSELYDEESEDDEAAQPQAMDVDADASVTEPAASDSKATANAASASASAAAASPPASPMAVDAVYDLNRRAANNYLTAQKLQLRIPSDFGEAKNSSGKAASAASPVNRTVVFSHRTASLLGRGIKRKREEEAAASEVITPRSAAAKAAGS